MLDSQDHRMTEAGGHLRIHLLEQDHSLPTVRQLLEISKKETPQSSWAACATALPPAQHTSAFWCSQGVSGVLISAHCQDNSLGTGNTEKSLALPSAPSIQVFTDISEIPLRSPPTWTVPALSSCPHRRGAPVSGSFWQSRSFMKASHPSMLLQGKQKVLGQSHNAGRNTWILRYDCFWLPWHLFW